MTQGINSKNSCCTYVWSVIQIAKHGFDRSLVSTSFQCKCGQKQVEAMLTQNNREYRGVCDVTMKMMQNLYSTFNFNWLFVSQFNPVSDLWISRHTYDFLSAFHTGNVVIQHQAAGWVMWSQIAGLAFAYATHLPGDRREMFKMVSLMWSICRNTYAPNPSLMLGLTLNPLVYNHLGLWPLLAKQCRLLTSSCEQFEQR